MICENFRVRSKKYKKYYFCTNSKKEITFEDCKNCSFCTYKKQNKLKVTPIKIKNKKSSKLAKSTEISQKIKEKVWNRDSQKCIYCGKYVSKSCANAHYIKRSHGGLGIEENIVTLCPECHFQEDNGQYTKMYEGYIEKYLKRIYGANWDKNKLVYKKY